MATVINTTLHRLKLILLLLNLGRQSLGEILKIFKVLVITSFVVLTVVLFQQDRVSRSQKLHAVQVQKQQSWELIKSLQPNSLAIDHYLKAISNSE